MGDVMRNLKIIEDFFHFNLLGRIGKFQPNPLTRAAG